MRTYRIRVFDMNWRTIREEYIKAEDLQAAELAEERIADECRDGGFEVRGTSLQRIR